MFNSKRERLRWRALLTETLPYEVPVIFSNDRFYAAKVANPESPRVVAALEKLSNLCAPGTAPYSYRINKDSSGRTELGIIHPGWQQRLAEFYDLYSQSILDFCRKSQYSLRRPVGIAAAFTENEIERDATLKLGIPHIDPREGDIDVSRLASYFTYADFILLNKFFDSPEFTDLEKRFRRLRTLDVTKCFFNIYTHTITWAVKERAFAKKNRNIYSFEGRFDELMQKSNSNETNGIIVGPEASRIFAEIIFQEIDKQIAQSISQRTFSKSCTVRRYVDDYFLFANSTAELDEIEKIVRDELGRYKLFLNEKKITDFERPFVSNISIARREIAVCLNALNPMIRELLQSTDERTSRAIGRSIRSQISDIRLIVSKYKVGFHTISGWLLSTLKGTIVDAVRAASGDRSAEQMDGMVDAASTILEAVFYICALDIRVRTSYSLCQIVSAVKQIERHCTQDQYDRLVHAISDQLSALIETVLRRDRQSPEESIELYNLLICGAHYLGPSFVAKDIFKEALALVLGGPRLRYFGYITAHFCMMKASDLFERTIADLNQRVFDMLMAAGPEAVAADAELYLFLCDYLASPTVSLIRKRLVLLKMVGGAISNQQLTALTKYLGFADWEGLHLEHTLIRKELRPVYAWS